MDRMVNKEGSKEQEMLLQVRKRKNGPSELSVMRNAMREKQMPLWEGQYIRITIHVCTFKTSIEVLNISFSFIGFWFCTACALSQSYVYDFLNNDLVLIMKRGKIIKCE